MGKQRQNQVALAACALLALACNQTNLTGSAKKDAATKSGATDGGDGGTDAGTDQGGNGPTSGKISQTPLAGETPVATNGGNGSAGNDGGSPANGSNVGNGSAESVFQDEKGDRREIFKFGGTYQAPVVDYLFVVDNSPSMTTKVQKLRDGIASLTADLFPEKAHLAVINTMPAKPADLTQSFNGAQQEPLVAANSEPGFMGLVNKERITSYKAANGAKVSQFTMDGCDGGWFPPDAKDAKGSRCFDAATQISLLGGPCEAGITAVAQYAQKLGDTRLFRKGAVVNVVFVSDTHDPGCGAGEGKTALDAARPKTFADFKAVVDKNSPGLAGLYAHGVVPYTTCSVSEGVFPSGTTYLDFIKASGGKSADLCTATDFKAVVQQIVQTDGASAPVFQLSKPAKKVISVSVDGTLTTDYTITDGDVITLKGLDGTKSVTIQVYYEPG